MTTIIVNIADLQDPNDPQGRSYRQVNAERKHAIPLGTLVELEVMVRYMVEGMPASSSSAEAGYMGDINGPGCDPDVP